MIVRTLKEFRPHESFKALAKEADPQSAYRVLETTGASVRGPARLRHRGRGVGVGQFPAAVTEELTLYEAVRGFSDHDLAELQTLLTALSSGRRIASVSTRATACSTAWRVT